MAQKNSDKMPKQKHAYLFLVLLFLLFACRDNGGSQPSGAAGSPNATSLQTGTGAEITLTLAVLPNSAAAYRALIQAFEVDHPGVTVRVENANRLIGDDPNPARALAQTADVFPSTYAFAGDWQALTLDLTPFAGAADFDAADFPAGLLTAADGTIRHLPVELDPFFIQYNKALFDVAKLAYPTPDWTWEDFLTLATQLTQRYSNFTAQYGWTDGLQANALVGAGLSQPLADYSTTPPTLRLVDKEVETAVSRYLNLYGNNGVAPTPSRSAITAYTNEYLRFIREGRVAMWLTSYSYPDNFNNLDVGILPLPVTAGNESRRLYVRSYGFAASAATQHPQVAWQLIEFLSQQQETTSLLPARASVRQATNAWEGADPQVVSVVEGYLDNSFEMPHVATRQAVGRAIVAVLLEGTDLSTALAQESIAAQEGWISEEEPLTAVANAADESAATIHILFMTDGFHRDRHRLLAQAFEEANPRLRVELGFPAYYVSGINVRSMDRTGNGQRADCFLYNPITTEAEAARVLDLAALLQLEPDLSHEDFYPTALNSFLYQGALVALPYQIQTPLIGYDTTLFNDAGVPYPEPGWTLQQFLETAVALTAGENENKQYGYVPFPGESADAWLFLHAFGANLLDRSAEPPTADFATPAVAEALRWYGALSETYGVKPDYLRNTYDQINMPVTMEFVADRSAVFSRRLGAMWWDDGAESDGAHPSPTAAIDERRYTTFPTAPDAEVALPVRASGLYISAEAGPEQRQACWQWITFLTERDAGLGVPARQEVAHSDEFRQRVGPAADVMLHSVTQLSQRQFETPPEWMNLQGWYSIALTRLLEEEMTAEEALALTQAEFEAYHRCVVDNNLFAPVDVRQRLFECAAPASPYVILSEE